MEKERFNEIINLVIEYLAVSLGICGTLHMLHYLKYISKEEKIYIAVKLHRKWKDNKNRYHYDGRLVDPYDIQSGRYRFPSDEKRIEFLNKLKEDYDN